MNLGAYERAYDEQTNSYEANEIHELKRSLEIFRSKSGKCSNFMKKSNRKFFILNFFKFTNIRRGTQIANGAERPN